MKKRSIIFCSLFCLLAFAGCRDNGGFKKTKSGILYKIISDGKGETGKKGQFLKVHYVQKVHDSVLASSFGSIPTYAPADSVGPIYNPTEIFSMLRKGDSAVIVMLADSLKKKQQGQLPPFIHEKDKLMLTIRVLDILPNEQAIQEDQQKLMAGKKDEEVKEIEKYLASKNVKAQKTEKGTFVEMVTPGTGAACDSGKAVHVKYRGKTFAGEIFDSNIDSSFGHTEPYVLVIGRHGAIEGWDDGLRLLNKGSKARLYVPSMLAYGGNPPQGAIFKPFENLMFDVEIVDVTEPPAPPVRRPMPNTP